MTELKCDMVEVFVFRRTPAGAEFLLLRRRPDDYLGGTWHPVSGRVEPGETAWRAGLRELREEAGVNPIAFWQADSVNSFYVAEFDRVFVCVVFAAEIALDAEVRLSEEHDSLRWEAESRIETCLLWPGQKRLVREITDEIIAAGPAERFLRIPLA